MGEMALSPKDRKALLGAAKRIKKAGPGILQAMEEHLKANPERRPLDPRALDRPNTY